MKIWVAEKLFLLVLFSGTFFVSAFFVFLYSRALRMDVKEPKVREGNLQTPPALH